MNRQNDIKTPEKNLSTLDVWAIAFGSMVGWGAFVMPGSTFLPVAGPAGSLLSMVIDLAVMLVIVYSVYYLMMRSPRPGGVYSFTKETFGRDHDFLCSCFFLPLLSDHRVLERHCAISRDSHPDGSCYTQRIQLHSCR
ncbi:MAG: APC family permease [Victivallales bacterium]|nr:APC family permease [Victivallales bacterium]